MQQLQAIGASSPQEVRIATPFFRFVNWKSALIAFGVVGLFMGLAAWQGSKKAVAEAKAELYNRSYDVLYKENQTRKQAEDQVWKYYPKVAEKYLPVQ